MAVEEGRWEGHMGGGGCAGEAEGSAGWGRTRRGEFTEPELRSSWALHRAEATEGGGASGRKASALCCGRQATGNGGYPASPAAPLSRTPETRTVLSVAPKAALSPPLGKVLNPVWFLWCFWNSR